MIQVQEQRYSRPRHDTQQATGKEGMRELSVGKKFTLKEFPNRTRYAR